MQEEYQKVQIKKYKERYYALKPNIQILQLLSDNQEDTIVKNLTTRKQSSIKQTNIKDEVIDEESNSSQQSLKLISETKSFELSLTDTEKLRKELNSIYEEVLSASAD